MRRRNTYCGPRSNDLLTWRRTTAVSSKGFCECFLYSPKLKILVVCAQVKCSSCGHASNTYDPFLDISLEINRVASVEEALEGFTRPEYLDGDNRYKCPKENTMVKAVKRMSIDKAPNVLVLQLKRFEFARLGRKITKKASANFLKDP